MIEPLGVGPHASPVGLHAPLGKSATTEPRGVGPNASLEEDDATGSYEDEGTGSLEDDGRFNILLNLFFTFFLLNLFFTLFRNLELASFFSILSTSNSGPTVRPVATAAATSTPARLTLRWRWAAPDRFFFDIVWETIRGVSNAMAQKRCSRPCNAIKHAT